MSEYSGFGRRPLVGAALCYAAGTRLGLCSAVEPVCLVAGAACACALTLWRVLGTVGRDSHGVALDGVLLYVCVFLVACASATVAVRAGGTVHDRPFPLPRAVAAKCAEFRRNASRYLSAGIETHPDAVALSRALLLGARGEISSEARDVFRATGTLHIFAISGLHVGIICMMIRVVLCRLRISKVYWVVFMAPLLILYTIGTGARASAVRACVMAIVYFFGPLLGRKADTSSALAFAAMVILVAAPAQLLDVGFILSFVVVAGIVAMYPVFDRPLRRCWAPDPARAGEERWGMRTARWCVRYVCSLLALSCSAWLASMPLTAYFFGRFAPVALIANLVVIPIVFLIVLAGSLSMLLGSCIWVFAEIFNNANLVLAWLLARTMKAVMSIPCGSMDVIRPPLWSVYAWYILLGSLALCFRSRPGQGLSDVVFKSSANTTYSRSQEDGL